MFRWLFLFIVVAGLLAAGLKFWSGGGRDPREAVRYTDHVRNMPPLRGIMSPTRDMIENDLEVLASWNVTLVRFQIMRNWLQVGTDLDLAEYDAWFDSRLDNLEKMLPIARRLGIRFVLDYHTPPGGRTEGNIMRMFDEEEYGEHFITVWKRIARRFKDNADKEALWAYDLLNEPIESPAASRRGACDKLMLRAAEAIREIDPDSVLMVSSLNGGGPTAFAKLKPMPLENVIYQAHMYSPFQYTHQFVLPETTPPIPGSRELLEYPSVIDGELWGKSRLRKELRPVRDFQLRYGARIYIGEFSTISWAPNGAEWLDDCISLFEEYGWDWSYHSFREWDGFSIEHEGMPPDRFWPAPGNPRMRVFLNALTKK